MNPFDDDSDDADDTVDVVVGAVEDENSNDGGGGGPNDVIDETGSADSDEVQDTTSPPKHALPSSSPIATNGLRTDQRRVHHHRHSHDVRMDGKDVKRSRRGHHNIHRPWQYDWKSPTWWKNKSPSTGGEGLSADTATSLSSKTESGAKLASCLDVTSAQVVWDECCPPMQTNPVRIVSNGDHNNEGRNLILSVSLLSSAKSIETYQQTASPSTARAAVGTKIHLELFAYRDQDPHSEHGFNKDNTTETTRDLLASPSVLDGTSDLARTAEIDEKEYENEMECIMSKLLTWPGSQMASHELLSETGERELEDDSKKESPWSWIHNLRRNLVSSPILPLRDILASRQTNPQERQKFDREDDGNSDGLVSIKLCRLKPSAATKNNQAKAFSSQDEEIDANIVSASDVRELINLMSLGGSSGAAAIDSLDSSALISAMLSSGGQGNKHNSAHHTSIADESRSTPKVPPLPPQEAVAPSTTATSAGTSTIESPSSSHEPQLQRRGPPSRSSSQSSDDVHDDDELYVDRVTGETNDDHDLEPNGVTAVPNVDNSSRIEQKIHPERNLLRLLCVTKSGHVHVYSPWELLLSDDGGVAKQSSTKNEHGDEEEIQMILSQPSGEEYHGDDVESSVSSKVSGIGDGKGNDAFMLAMENLFLGSALQTRLQHTVLPLCQPIATMSLTTSVDMNIKRSMDEATGKYQPLPNRSPHDRSGSRIQYDDQLRVVQDGENSDSDDGPSSSSHIVSLWDPILWNPTVELSTIKYKTIRNSPTLTCLAGQYEPYLVVAGHGLRPEQYKYRRRVAGKKDTTPPPRPQPTNSGTTKQAMDSPSPAAVLPLSSSTPALNESGSGSPSWWTEDGEDDDVSFDNDNSDGFQHQESLLPLDGWHMDRSSPRNEEDDDDSSKKKNEDTKKRGEKMQHEKVRIRRRSKTSSKKQPPPWKPLADAATARMETATTTRYHEGGFVTIFSLSYFAETKTLYLPFRPQHISSFSWNCYHDDNSVSDFVTELPLPIARNQDDKYSKFSFLMVLGHHPSQAIAICLETATTVPYQLVRDLIGLPNSGSTVGASTLGEITQSAANARAALHQSHLLGVWKQMASLRRFQVLPIDIPHHDDGESNKINNSNGGNDNYKDGKLSSRLLVASSPHDTVPPALLLAYYEKPNEDIDDPEHLMEHHEHDHNHSPHPPRRRHVMIVQRTLDRLSTKRLTSSSSPAELFKVDSYSTEDGASFEMKGSNSKGLGAPTVAINTTISSRHVARIALDIEDDDDPANNLNDPLDDLWSYLGQGWCLVGAGQRVHFICWEGSTSSRGAYCARANLGGALAPGIHLSLNSVLPLPGHHSEKIKAGFSPHLYRSDQTSGGLDLPFTSTYQLPAALKPEDQHDHHILESDTLGKSLDDSYKMDDIVVDALERISGLSYRLTTEGGMTANLVQIPHRSSPWESTHQQASNSPVPERRTLSHREMSHQLLRKCESWMQLEDTVGNRNMLGTHLPVVHIVAPEVRIINTNQGQTIMTHQYLLALREVVIGNGPASPFQQVLSWLSTDQHDFFTAASVALDLLRDAESLNHLWNFADERIDQDEEETKLEGLLDGIIPISTAPVPDAATTELQVSPTPSPPAMLMTQLADMTVGCLAKGGYPMSRTLQKFLGRNTHYDPARACLMLVATTANAVSDDLQSVSEVMGTRLPSLPSKDVDSVLENLLWPLKCLLTIGNTRNYLQPALLLLNATIPDELRRRPRKSQSFQSHSLTTPSMYLCKKLAALIVGASQQASALFLDLVDGSSGSRFWNSINHETKLELALIEIKAGCPFPLLREPEVRDWVRVEVDGSLRNIGSGGTTASERIPTWWLQNLCSACLRNAGCELDDFLVDQSKQVMGVSPDAVDEVPTTVDDDGLEQHKLIFSGTRTALTEGSSSGSPSENLWGAVFLDFDLLIPCLLLLVSREALWRPGEYVSTQTLLDATCSLAGLPTHQDADTDPQFAFDGTAAMIQCAHVRNIRAAGHLVGGVNGFVLRCCDVLRQELSGMTMDEAETIFLEDRIPLDVIDDLDSADGKVIKPSEKVFVATDAHRQLLWLFDEYVLSLRTYGEFETTHIRGRVDPVFAARSLFRAWLCLVTASTSEIRMGTDWLVAWLRVKLGMGNGNNASNPASGTVISKHRLVCAAMIRALAWPSTADSSLSATSSVSDNGRDDEEPHLKSSPSDRLILGTVLQVEPKFLVQLAQSCCGLVESLPPSIAEDIIRKATGDKNNGFPKTAGSSQLSPTRIR